VASILNIDVRKGMVIVHEGQLWLCIDRDLRTPGNLPSKLTLKLKNLKTGFVNEFRVHPENKTEQAYLDRREMEYLYKDSDGYVFMDKESYEQFTLGEDMVGDLPLFLKENNTCQVTFYEGKALSIDLPAQVELKVVETDPALKGATAAAQYKPATLETGLKLSVPPFIGIGEMIQVDTNEGKYLGRAK
jgi:elongation factor P